jgi:hypothetical protein
MAYINGFPVTVYQAIQIVPARRQGFSINNEGGRGTGLFFDHTGTILHGKPGDA